MRCVLFKLTLQSMTYVDVILPLPLDGLFTYSVPPSLEGQAEQGRRVLVPLGKSRKYVGLIARVHGDTPREYAVRDILGVMDSSPVVLDVQCRLWRWIADYYMSAPGDVYKAALPAGLKSEDGYRPRTELYIRLAERFADADALHVALGILGRSARQKAALECYLDMSCMAAVCGGEEGARQKEITREELMNASHATLAVVNALVKRGIMETYSREVGRLNSGGEPHPENIKPLSGAQRQAFDAIMASFATKDVTLLHGVTSSGKTEIYIHMIQQAIGGGRQVLYLLPEIALTVQIMERLRRVFGSRLGIYHSRYSDAERVEIWRKQLSDSPYDVILGARSAVFLPFRRLGLVIVDEEHDSSYKQQEPAPRYHARSAAIVMARMCGAKTLLGTATPCAESYHNATTGKYGLVELTRRYEGTELPEVQIVDVADLRRRKMMSGPLSPLLMSKVREALERGGQTILFQNRRGFAPVVECRQCGWVPKCQNCDVSLTLHRSMGQLTCHYCGFTYRVPEECPACGGKELRSRGYGTEKIEECVRDVFPGARVARMDLDTTRTRNAYERIISDFSAGRTDILIGTQMVSKGLDFGRVSVVGILNADSMMNYPDFRAYESAFMMMAQVSGRAGRRGRRGLVVLQTMSPDLPLIRQVVSNDYKAMFVGLMAERKAFRYPPFSRLIYVYLKHSREAVADTAGIEMGSRLRQWFGARVLGPDKPAVARVKAQSIRKIVLKLETGIDMARVRACLRLARRQMEEDPRYGALTVYFDVDPQ